MAAGIEIAFSGAALDRAGARRTDERWVAAAASDPSARAVAVARDAVLVIEGRLARLELASLRPLARGEPLLLGVDGEQPLFAVDLDGSSLEPLGEGCRLLGLREAAATLPPADGGLAAYATGLANWHRRHPFCAVCGSATAAGEGGHVRRCPRCGAVHHPRTDPVVIVVVADGDRALLGRQPTWPPGRYSALAGFVEPGEALEEAVAREVREEAGVEVDRIEYHGSQPWPFPSSLMLGFLAGYAAGEAHPADRELDDVRWFTRAELLAAERGTGSIALPPPIAIARHLIDAWLVAA